MTDQTILAPAADNGARRGFFLALTAYLIWGGLPLYMKAVSHVPAMEVLVHRVLWSVPVAGLVLLVMGQINEIKLAFRNPRILLMAALTATLITLNWGVYIWAVSNNHALDAALGYFINPLFSIFLGAVLLGEKLQKIQYLAILSVIIGVSILTWQAGGLPIVALCLTVSWGFYAFLRKTMPIGGAQGLFLEVLILTPLALGYFAYIHWTGTAYFMSGDSQTDVLLLLAGIITAVPLMLFTSGSKYLRLSTLGIMQYIAPTLIFVCAVFVFGEPFDNVKLVAFAFIWAAVVIYTSAIIKKSA
jgi:chloramphenicol-sensitive protein RarD